jgi:heterotetrameric sarcosine oxidase gamma subunit
LSLTIGSTRTISVSKPERASFLAAHLPVGRHGSPNETPLLISEMVLDAIEVTARRGGEAKLRGAVAELGLELPGLGAFSESDGVTALCLSPGTWTLVARPETISGVARRLQALCREDQAARHADVVMVDIGHSLAFVTLSGVAVRRTLARGCQLDLHLRTFKPGQAARTIIAHLPATLWMISDKPEFCIAVPITLAQGFARFMLTASAETGCEIRLAEKE